MKKRRRRILLCRVKEGNITFKRDENVSKPYIILFGKKLFIQKTEIIKYERLFEILWT